MNPDAVVDPWRRWLTTRVVGSDDKCLVAGSAQMLEDPQDRVRHTVDVGKEGFGDYCNPHGSRLRQKGFRGVAARDTASDDLPTIHPAARRTDAPGGGGTVLP